MGNQYGQGRKRDSRSGEGTMSSGALKWGVSPAHPTPKVPTNRDFQRVYGRRLSEDESNGNECMGLVCIVNASAQWTKAQIGGGGAQLHGSVFSLTRVWIISPPPPYPPITPRHIEPRQISSPGNDCPGQFLLSSRSMEFVPERESSFKVPGILLASQLLFTDAVASTNIHSHGQRRRRRRPQWCGVSSVRRNRNENGR